jgi:hypothetical protein
VREMRQLTASLVWIVVLVVGYSKRRRGGKGSSCMATPKGFSLDKTLWAYASGRLDPQHIRSPP